MTTYERLKKILTDNKDSFDIDENGIIQVKEEALLKAVENFKDEFDGF